MASSSKHFPSLLILFALLSSLQYCHARESYFFNKATTTNNNNAKETVEQAILSKSNVQEKPEPNFIPDTQSGYGLYGQDSSRYTTTTTTANQPPEINSFEPYTTPTATNNKNNNYYKDEAYVSDPQAMMSDTRFMDKNNNNYYKDEAYVSDHQGVMSGTRFMDNNNNNNYYQNTAYVSDPNEDMSQGTRNNYYNSEQQGMSDTRFLENGRYYYDINGEENYRNGPNGYQKFTRVNHNNRGYYGNYNGGSMEGYSQNGDDQFHESEAEYVP